MNMPSTDVKSIQDIVKDKLGAQIAGLIPQEAWDKMIEAGVDDLLTPREYNIPWKSGGRQMLSPLQFMINQQLVELYKASIKAEFEKNPDLKDGVWLPEQQKFDIPKVVKEVLAENSEAFMKLMISQMFGGVMQESIEATRRALSASGIQPRY